MKRLPHGVVLPFAGGDESEARQLRAWAGLAIAALAFAGSPALLLAASRIPGIESLTFWPLDYFERALVVHVVLSIVVWTLACFGAMAHVGAISLGPQGQKLKSFGPISALLGWLALPLLMIPGFSNLGEPSLNNYVPVILHPVYGAGLACIFISVLLAVIRLWANLAMTRGKLPSCWVSVCIIGLIYIFALGNVVVSSLDLGSEAWSESDMEQLFWGGGHILQFVNLGLMLIGLYILYYGFGEGELFSGNRLLLICILIMAPTAISTKFWRYDNSYELFSQLKFFAGIPAVLFLIFAWPAIRRSWSNMAKTDPGFLAFFLAMGVFALGGTLGFFVDGTDTRTPSHYHGVLGAVNLVLMGLFYCLFLPLLGRETGNLKRIPWQLWLYALGQSFQCLGLFLAGGYGAPRKTAGADQDLEHIGAIAGMYMNGVGALIAVIGGILFIWTMAWALGRGRTERNP